MEKCVYHQSQSNIITKSSSKSLVIYFGVFKVYRSTSKYKSTIRHKSTPSLPWSHYAKFPKDCTIYKNTWYIGSWNLKLLNLFLLQFGKCLFYCPLEPQFLKNRSFDSSEMLNVLNWNIGRFIGFEWWRYYCLKMG